MKLLLDTHIWVWSALDRSRLTPKVVKELQNPDNERWLSPISVWEVLVLSQKGRLTLNPNPLAWIANVLSAVPMREAQVTYEVAQETGRVQLPQRDPADRFLVATARILHLTLVTAAAPLIQSRTVPILANR